MKNLLIIGVIVIAVVGFLLWINNSSPKITSRQDNNQMNEKPKEDSENELSFSNPKKSAHYESNTPAHASTLADAPINVVINFNFDLAKPSEIKILKDGQDAGIGETIIDTNKLAMRRNINPNILDGLYTVEYKACWPDGSCHDGNFQFAIDRKQSANFDDQTNKEEVAIKLSQIKFSPQNVKVSRGTRVIWINDEEVEHYVNTDSHPAHTYYPAQNSKILKKGDSFSLVFDTPGAYPYHCSAHASSMLGNLLVEN